MSIYFFISGSMSRSLCSTMIFSLSWFSSNLEKFSLYYMRSSVDPIIDLRIRKLAIASPMQGSSMFMKILIKGFPLSFSTSTIFFENINDPWPLGSKYIPTSNFFASLIKLFIPVWANTTLNWFCKNLCPRVRIILLLLLLYWYLR